MIRAPYEDLVRRHGLSEAQRRLLAVVPDGARVLDVGCATGYLGVVLRERGCIVLGVEADPVAVSAARERGLEVVAGSAEDPAVLQEARARGPFDVVLCGDVLEHLVEPGRVLRTLAGAAPRAVVSLPNVAHWTGRRALLRGRFPREPYGLFDATHLRWFTQDSARDLATQAGWTVDAIHPVGAPLPLQSRVPALARLQPVAVARRPRLFALQFVLELSARPRRAADRPAHA